MTKTKTQQKRETRARRRGRVRSQVSGTADRPRLSVFRSNRVIYAQIIDDEKGTTIASSDSRSASGKNMIEKARVVGSTIAELAKKHKVKDVVFDRGGFLYTGQVKALADAAREAGLTF